MLCPFELTCRTWPTACPLMRIIRARRRTYLLEATLFGICGLMGLVWLLLEVFA